jgi:hypothetical protein
MILNEQEFKEFISPLQEINEYLHKAKLAWMNHMEDITNKAIDNFDMDEKQENIYLVLCEKMGNGILELFKNIEVSQEDLDKLNKNYKMKDNFYQLRGLIKYEKL